jgi:WD40 repeat protein
MDAIYEVAFSPDGKMILTGSGDHTARLWDAATGMTVQTLTGQAGPLFGAAFSPDGKQVFTQSGEPDGGGEASMRRWDVATGKTLQIYTSNAANGYVLAYVAGLAMSHDGNHFLTAVGFTDISAIMWDATVPTDDQEGQYFTGHTGGGWGLAFSPDDKTILTSGDDHTALLGDVATRKTVQTFTGHTGGVMSVAFSPDGKYALTGSQDHTARLWDAATGKTVQIFNGHTGSVESVAFSPDGQQVLTGSEDHTARLWQVQPQP